MSNLYLALDEDLCGNVWISGIFPSLQELRDSYVEYTEIREIGLDSLDKGIYIEDDVLNVPYISIYD